MKLIFVLILIVGIMAWFLMPTKPQNATSSNKSTVQTNNKTSTTPSTGKAIWDGKLTVDENTVEELLDRPHNELSAEEVALKAQMTAAIAYKTGDKDKFEKSLECLTDKLKQIHINSVKEFGLKPDSSLNQVDLSAVAIASIEQGSSAKVMIMVNPRNDAVNRRANIVNLYKTNHGWVTDDHAGELITNKPIRINGKYYSRFMLVVRRDGIIAMAIPAIKDPKSKTGYTTASIVDITDQHITVDALLESLMK